MIGAACVLVVLHLLINAAVWLVSPWPWAAGVVSIMGSLLLILALRWQVRDHRNGWLRWVTVLLWQAPGLITGGWALAMFCGVAPLADAPVFILQVWLHLWSPWWACIPGGFTREVGWYLWATAAAPFFWSGVMAWLVIRWHQPTADHNPAHGSDPPG